MLDILNSFVLLANYIFVPAIAYGAQLALGALGITLVYGILRFANFAHGDTMSFGAMVCILITWALQSAGFHFWFLPTALLALPPAILIVVVFVLATDKLVYSHFRKINDKPIRMVMASVGVMFIMGGVVRFIIGAGDRNFADGERFILKARTFKTATGLSEGITIKLSQLLTVSITCALVIALFWFLQKTKTGKAMRAFSDNETLALLCGISPTKIVTLTWIISATLATIAGVLYGLDKSFKPFVYFQLLLPMFAAAILGGIGKPMGAIVGGFIIAFCELVITYAYKKFFIYLVGWHAEGLLQILSTNYKFAVSFAILVVVLLLRPNGILKGRLL